MKRARGTHRGGSRLRDGPVVVLLEVDVQLDDAGPATQDGSSEQVTLRASHGHALLTAQGDGSSQPNSRNLCTLRGKAQQRSLLQNMCWGRDVALLLKKHLCTWNLLQGCPLCFFPSCLIWSEASPEHRAACAPVLLVLQPQGHSSRIVQQPQGGRSPGPGSALSSQSGHTRSCWRGWVVLVRCLLTMQKLSIFFLFCSDLFLGPGIRAGPGWSFVPAQAVLQYVG